MHHELKLLATYETPKRQGLKNWEYRSTADRTFHVGDTVTFNIVTNA